MDGYAFKKARTAEMGAECRRQTLGEVGRGILQCCEDPICIKSCRRKPSFGSDGQHPPLSRSAFAITDQWWILFLVGTRQQARFAAYRPLHFTIFKLEPQKHWRQDTTIDPYPLLPLIIQSGFGQIHGRLSQSALSFCRVAWTPVKIASPSSMTPPTAIQCWGTCSIMAP